MLKYCCFFFLYSILKLHVNQSNGYTGGLTNTTWFVLVQSAGYLQLHMVLWRQLYLTSFDISTFVHLPQEGKILSDWKLILIGVWKKKKTTPDEYFLKAVVYLTMGLPWWLRWWRVCLQCRRPGFDTWVWKIPWRGEWQPTPVFLPGEFHGQKSLACYSSWGHKEWDMTEQLTLQLLIHPL